MKSILLIALISFVVIAGCSSVAIYETEKISITVESRGDVSQPVSANIGVKQRVALIVPGTKAQLQTLSGNDYQNDSVSTTSGARDGKGVQNENKDKKTDAEGNVNGGITQGGTAPPAAEAITGDAGRHSSPGEAVSAVSYFNFDYDSGNATTISDNTVTIETVILTGKATPDKRKAPIVFKTISTPAKDTRFNLTRFANASLMYRGLKNMKKSGDDTAGKHIEALDKLHTILPEKYPFTLYGLVPGTFDNFRAHGAVKTGGNINKDDKFLAVTSYLASMDRAILALEEMINAQKLKIDGEAKTPDSTFKDVLKAKKLELEKMSDEKNKELFGNPVFQSAFDYYIKMVKE